VVADLLDQASYDEPTGRQLHVALAELGQLVGWCGYDAGQPGECASLKWPHLEPE